MAAAAAAAVEAIIRSRSISRNDSSNKNNVLASNSSDFVNDNDERFLTTNIASRSNKKNKIQQQEFQSTCSIVVPPNVDKLLATKIEIRAIN